MKVSRATALALCLLPFALDAAASRVEGLTIEGGAASTALAFELVNHHLYAEVWLAGKGPYRMLLDPAGPNRLAPEIAKGLELERRGEAAVAELRLGKASLPGQVFTLAPMAELRAAEGLEVAGTLGAEVLQRFALTLDYAQRRLTLTLPERFAAPAKVKALPLTFSGALPVVRAELDGRKLELAIDPGSHSSLTLSAAAPVANAPAVDATTGWSFEGAVKSHVARGGTLRLGRFEVSGFLVETPLAPPVAAAAKAPAGRIGNGVLKRFTVTLDYGAKKLYLQPNEGALLDREDFDRSGLWLAQHERGFLVTDVIASSPAAESGLKVGDLIREIAQQGPGAVTLPELRRYLRTARPETEFTLVFERQGQRRGARIKLRELL